MPEFVGWRGKRVVGNRVNCVTCIFASWTTLPFPLSSTYRRLIFSKSHRGRYAQISLSQVYDSRYVYDQQHLPLIFRFHPSFIPKPLISSIFCKSMMFFLARDGVHAVNGRLRRNVSYSKKCFNYACAYLLHVIKRKQIIIKFTLLPLAGSNVERIWILGFCVAPFSSLLPCKDPVRPCT